MTKKDLLPLAKTYFDSDPNRTEIFGTEDKHFFNSEGDVRYYCKTEKEYFHFTKADFIEKEAEKPKEVKVIKETPKTEVKVVKKVTKNK